MGHDVSRIGEILTFWFGSDEGRSFTARKAWWFGGGRGFGEEARRRLAVDQEQAVPNPRPQPFGMISGGFQVVGGGRDG